ncbi:MAG: glycosyltransferase, partial [Candidatus Binatia bacterium]
GSQGAQRLNAALLEAAAALRAALADLHIIHQTGAAECAASAAAYARHGIDAEVVAFIDDRGEAYPRADLVVCRAGATTVAELTALGKAAILVPYPFAADDHQRANASVLAARGAGLLVLDAECTGARLAAEIIALATDRGRLRRMGEAARALGVPDAASRVVATCRAVVAEGGGG